MTKKTVDEAIADAVDYAMTQVDIKTLSWTSKGRELAEGFVPEYMLPMLETLEGYRKIVGYSGPYDSFEEATKAMKRYNNSNRGSVKAICPQQRVGSERYNYKKF